MARILVIDDDPAIRGIMRRILERSGHGVVEAENGSVGMKLVSFDPPDLVVTDLLMPEKEGIETIQELKTLHPAVRVVAVSGAGGGTDGPLMDAELFGADATLAKPFSVEGFQKVIDEVLSRG